MWRTTDPVVNIAAGEIPGSDNAIVRVTANDGTNAAQSEVGPIAVPNVAPRVSIGRPAGDEVYDLATTDRFVDRAYDLEGAPLTLPWSVNGVTFATGSEPLVDFETLGVGTHPVTLTATDPAGLSTSAAVTVEVANTESAPNSAPDLFVVSPATGSTIEQPEPLRLTASTFDPEGDEVTVIWESDRAGLLLTGESGIIDKTTLGLGQHVITITATDATGRPTVETVLVEILESSVIGPDAPSTPNPLPTRYWTRLAHQLEHEPSYLPNKSGYFTTSRSKPQHHW